MGWIETVVEQGIETVAAQVSIKTTSMRSLTPCPACGAERRGSSDRRGPLGVDPKGMAFKCFKCGIAGDAVDLLAYSQHGDRFRNLDRDQMKEVHNLVVRTGIVADTSQPRVASVGGMIRRSKKPPHKPVESPETSNGTTGSGGVFGWTDELVTRSNAVLWEGMSDGGIHPVLDYLRVDRCFSDATIKHWKLGAIRGPNGKWWLTIPLLDAKGNAINVRFRSIPPDKKAYRVSPGRSLPLYGINTLDADRDLPVIITEGELDVIALYEMGFKTNVVSGTAGAGAAWKEDWLDALEPYQSFVLCYDDDDAGHAGATKVAEKLGNYRCSKVILPRNDANECLMYGVPVSEVKAAINGSAPMIDARIRTVDSYADELEKLIRSPQVLVGNPSGSDKFDKLVGGIRPGLWVLTGETGHGKTTFATWLVYEQACRGIAGMLTSFEQAPIGTVQKLLRAEVGGDFLQCSEDRRRRGLESLGNLPLYIMDHYGEATPEKVIESIRYARRRHGVKIALVDHLGFLTRGAGDKERQRIEEVVRDLALLAVTDDITIMLICHPNRTFTHQQRRVKISDLKGASAIEQDCHVGIVVERQALAPQRGFPAAKVYVDKVRSEFGSPGGHILLPFDPLACVFADTWEQTPSGRSGVRPVTPE